MKTLVDLVKINYRFRSDFADEQIFETVVLSTDLLDELCFVLKGGFENAALYSFNISGVRR